MSRLMIFRRVYFFPLTDLTTLQLERAAQDAAHRPTKGEYWLGKITKTSAKVVTLDEVRELLEPDEFDQVLVFYRDGLHPVLIEVEMDVEIEIPLIKLNVRIGEQP